jgi:hypothetical protein
MPLGDWQFWVVSAIGVLALAAATRPLWPFRKDSSGACPGCPTNGNRHKRTSLTVEGERVR